MRSFTDPLVWAVLCGASPAFAAFETFSWAGQGGNSSAPRKCGDMIYECPAPSMCSMDTLTRKWYCCEPGNQDGPCWNGASTCGGSGTNQPSGQQIGCSNLDVNYCCSDAEQCTKNAKQFRICWSKQENPIRFLNSTELNQTYSSLSSAQPSATSITIDKAKLLAMTSTTPGVSPSSTPTSASATSSITSSSTPASSSSSGLSGGAIGGIVGGIVGGLALLGAIGFFLWRRKRSAQGASKTNPHASAGDPYQGYAYQPQQPVHEAAYNPQQDMAQVHGSYAPPPTDKYAHTHQGPVEVPANSSRPVEMDGGQYHPPK